MSEGGGCYRAQGVLWLEVTFLDYVMQNRNTDHRSLGYVEIKPDRGEYMFEIVGVGVTLGFNLVNDKNR